MPCDWNDNNRIHLTLLTMKESTKQLMIAERRRSDFGFIAEVIQRGRNKPKKYKHFIKMPTFLYEELRNKGTIDPEQYFIDESAFFEFNDIEVTINFINLFAREDMHMKILHYLVIKFAGSDPIQSGGVFF